MKIIDSRNEILNDFNVEKNTFNNFSYVLEDLDYIDVFNLVKNTNNFLFDFKNTKVKTEDEISFSDVIRPYNKYDKFSNDQAYNVPVLKLDNLYFINEITERNFIIDNNLILQYINEEKYGCNLVFHENNNIMYTTFFVKVNDFYLTFLTRFFIKSVSADLNFIEKEDFMVISSYNSFNGILSRNFKLDRILLSEFENEDGYNNFIKYLDADKIKKFDKFKELIDSDLLKDKTFINKAENIFKQKIEYFRLSAYLKPWTGEIITSNNKKEAKNLKYSLHLFAYLMNNSYFDFDKNEIIHDSFEKIYEEDYGIVISNSKPTSEGRYIFMVKVNNKYLPINRYENKEYLEFKERFKMFEKFKA